MFNDTPEYWTAGQRAQDFYRKADAAIEHVIQVARGGAHKNAVVDALVEAQQHYRLTKLAFNLAYTEPNDYRQQPIVYLQEKLRITQEWLDEWED